MSQAILSIYQAVTRFVIKSKPDYTILEISPWI